MTSTKRDLYERKPKTPRRCGTRAKYVLDKCRCAPCTRANADYARERDRRQRRPDVEFVSAYVNVREVRRHLAWLRSQGVGLYRISELARVRRSTLQAIAAGQRKRMLRANADRILAIGKSRAADRALVPAAETWRLIEELLAAGWTKGRIAMALGAQRPRLQLGRQRITAKHARAIAELHRKHTTWRLAA